MTLAAPLYLLLLALVPWAGWAARGRYAGLAPLRRRLALTLRALALALVALALAEPRRPAGGGVTVLYVVDRSASVADAVRWERVRRLIDASITRAAADPANRAGVIVFGRKPRLAVPPVAGAFALDPRLGAGVDPDGTDVAAALKLALASFPDGGGRRVVLFTDGNETVGRADDVAALMAKSGVALDAVALAPGLRRDSEVLVQAVDAPPPLAGARGVTVLLRNVHPSRLVEGRLTVARVAGGVERPLPVDDALGVLDPSAPALVRLEPGLGRFRFTDRAGDADEAVTYRAAFAPARSYLPGGAVLRDGLPGDRPDNNAATAVAPGRATRRALLVDAGPDRARSPHAFLLETLAAGDLPVDYAPVSRLPDAPGELAAFLANYDALLLADVPFAALGAGRTAALRAAVRDGGCGLVVAGGPNSFGPGGYRGTILEELLPVECAAPPGRAEGRVGVALVLHAGVPPAAARWQRDLAALALRRLRPGDWAGVAQYGAGGGADWPVPFQEVGADPSPLVDAVEAMGPFHSQPFESVVPEAARLLADPARDLAARHLVLVSAADGSYAAPQGRNDAVAKAVARGVECVTVGLDERGQRAVVLAPRDAEGKPRGPSTVADPSLIPALDFAANRRISRPALAEGEVRPTLVRRDGPAGGLPAELPPLFGYVRTGAKASPLVERFVDAPDDGAALPVLAAWRVGLGKVAAFTSDARAGGWCRAWAGAGLTRRFWTQVFGWSARDAERGRLVVSAEARDGALKLRADARDDAGRPADGLTLSARVTGPGGAELSAAFRPRGGGAYEAEVPADAAGAYFAAVRAESPGGAAFDAARGAAAVPYPREFADLESDTPAVRRLAESAGGRFHPEPAAEADAESLAADAEFSRPAPPRGGSSPLWPALLTAAGFALLGDVAARRLHFGGGRREVVADAPAALDRLTARKRATGERMERPAVTLAAPEEPAVPPAAPGEAGGDPLERLRKARDRARGG